MVKSWPVFSATTVYCSGNLEVEFDWFLHCGTGRHSANHNLLPDMHLRVPVLSVTTSRDNTLVKT